MQEASTTRRPAVHQRHSGATGSDAGGFLPRVPVARLRDGGGPKIGGATPQSCLMRSFTFTGDRISGSRPVVWAGTRLIRAGCTAGVLPFWLSLHLILGPWPKSSRLRLLSYVRGVFIDLNHFSRGFPHALSILHVTQHSAPSLRRAIIFNLMETLISSFWK